MGSEMCIRDSNKSISKGHWALRARHGCFGSEYTSFSGPKCAININSFSGLNVVSVYTVTQGVKTVLSPMISYADHKHTVILSRQLPCISGETSSPALATNFTSTDGVVDEIRRYIFCRTELSKYHDP